MVVDPGGPEVKTAFQCVVSIPGWWAEIPYASMPKYQNIKIRSNIVTNLVKTLKIAHIKKSFKKLKEGNSGWNRICWFKSEPINWNKCHYQGIPMFFWTTCLGGWEKESSMSLY